VSDWVGSADTGIERFGDGQYIDDLRR